MKSKMRGIAAPLVLVCSIAGASGCSQPAIQREVARVQSSTTPFESLRTKFTLHPGETYLNFMMKSVKPALDAFDKEVRQEAKRFPNQYSRWQEDLISAGKGVGIRIDSQNYFFNIGYTDGSQADDIKSGRSYGVGPTNRQSDPSDRFYLQELQKYFESEPDGIEDFIRAILLVLTDCDPSGWRKLSVAGQIVATDFLAIYTAESDRHLMVKLSPVKHPWEIDLAAATFVSVFVAKTGEIMQNGKLVKGALEQWWAQGNSGSGIGNTRKDRKKLQGLIADFANSNKKHAELIQAVEKASASSKNHDVIQGVFEFLNHPPQGPAHFDSAALTQAMVQYISQISQDSGAILNSIP